MAFSAGGFSLLRNTSPRERQEVLRRSRFEHHGRSHAVEVELSCDWIELLTLFGNRMNPYATIRSPIQASVNNLHLIAQQRQASGGYLDARDHVLRRLGIAD